MGTSFLKPRVLAASIAASLLVTGMAWQGLHAAPSATAGTAATATSTVPQRYIVRFNEPALAMHNKAVRSAAVSGGVRSFGTPELIPYRLYPSGRSHLDVHSSEAQTYLADLRTAQDTHLAQIKATVGRDVTATRRFQHALNGVVMELTQAEAFKIARLSGVASVVPDRAHALADDLSTKFVGARNVWVGSKTLDSNSVYTFPTLDSLFGDLNKTSGFKGDGVVIGDIDTGYNSASPSFAAVDESGYAIVNPLGSGNYLGDCGVAGISTAGCNDKVIGVYDEVSTQYYGSSPESVEDSQGHGSHTASTMVGNPRESSLPGFLGNISGLAPHANLVVYYACAPDPVQCQDSATAGAVDQAIQDQIVDVLNYSISGGAEPWYEPVSQAFLAAEEAGIFVAAAGGNTGSSVPQAVAGTVNHAEPWVATVAATSLPGGAAYLVLGLTGPGTPPSATQVNYLTEGTYDTPLSAALPGTTAIVVSPTFANSDLTGTDGCTAYPSGVFNNAIALISRGTCTFSTKVGNAVAAGAVAVVIADNRDEGSFSPTVGPPRVYVPVYSMYQSDGAAIAAYLSTHKNTGTASLGYMSARYPDQADVVADFSLLGPSAYDTIKPDIAAPGVAVLAAVANDGSTNGPDLMAFYDGTSMATPHVTSSAALLMGLHPDWTPSEVKSALMMTAKESGLVSGLSYPYPAAGFYDRGSGRLQTDLASRAGLVLDETGANFTAANPDIGGSASTLNLASMQNSQCALGCTFTRTFTAVSSTTWSASVSGELADKIAVSPATFSTTAGSTYTLTFTVNTKGLGAGDGYHFGEVTLAPSGSSPVVAFEPSLHLPIAVAVPKPVLDVSTDVVDIALSGAASGSATFNVTNAGGGALSFAPLSSGTQPFVWSNQASSNYYGETSTLYTQPGAADSDYYAADDFTVTGNDKVDLATISTPGFSYNHSLSSFGSTLPIHFRIYADASGVPSSDPDTGGTAAWSFDTTAGSTGVSVSGDTISLDLVAAGQSTQLAAGRYWLVVYPELPCSDTYGYGCTEGWAWMNSWAGNGSAPVLIAPQLAQYDTWASQGSAYGGGLAMSIKSVATCSTPSWLSLSPNPGSVGSASSTTVTATATAAGYAPATSATAYVCLGSSFQSNSGVIVPTSTVVPVQINANN